MTIRAVLTKVYGLNALEFRRVLPLAIDETRPATKGNDPLLLVIYGLLMLVLTIYAVHAYLMLYLYRKNRVQCAKPLPAPAVWPRTTVQLPI